MKRSGTADLPLHGGRVPVWLAERMTLLGTMIVEHIVLEYGSAEFLTRISDPFWFQALGCVMGMDWHSSGITTSVMSALKRGMNPRFSDLGLFICGGRGHHKNHRKGLPLSSGSGMRYAPSCNESARMGPLGKESCQRTYRNSSGVRIE